MLQIILLLKMIHIANSIHSNNKERGDTDTRYLGGYDISWATRGKGRFQKHTVLRVLTCRGDAGPQAAANGGKAHEIPSENGEQFWIIT